MTNQAYLQTYISQAIGILGNDDDCDAGQGLSYVSRQGFQRPRRVGGGEGLRGTAP